MKSYLSEIFSSIQGEGPYVGERHLFVRFCECHRNGLYCDTDTSRAESVQVERFSGAGVLDAIANPMSVDALYALIAQIDSSKTNHQISLTGGAPLLQIDFLCALLPRLKADGHRIYLESAGDLPRKLEQVAEWIDVVSMDVKLASVTHEPNTFSAHWDFLTVCRAKKIEVFVKLVLSSETDGQELMEALEGIKAAGGEDTLVVIQPMTRAEQTDAVPSVAQLFSWQEQAMQVLRNVRVIPQTHKMLEVL